MAHQALAPQGALTGAPEVYIEPDLYQSWLYDNPGRTGGIGAAPGETCGYNDQAADLPRGPDPGKPEFGWHLRDDFSQLKAARDQVAQAGPALVRLGIMDVGFDFHHQTKPEHVREDLQRNFVDDGQSPTDPRIITTGGYSTIPAMAPALLGSWPGAS